jgi:hypothetical protein
VTLELLQQGAQSLLFLRIAAEIAQIHLQLRRNYSRLSSRVRGDFRLTT